jgi:MFS family permease
MSIGAATLADVYEPFERGTKLGIFYAAPLLGPALGPILGGLLAQEFSWRASFWLLAVYLGANLVLFVFFFRDTFRKERSFTYQRVLASRRCTAPKRSSVVSDPAHELDSQSKGEAAVTTEEATVTTGEASGPSAGPTATVAIPQAGTELTLSLKDVNPFPPLLLILKRRNNVAALIASGKQNKSAYSLTEPAHPRFRTCLCPLNQHPIYVLVDARRSL